jgi:hypothetical protein
MLAGSGWEAFLAHDSTRCSPNCKTCDYWREVWPDATQRSENMKKACRKISSFRARYPESLEWSRKAKPLLRQKLDNLYRECQVFATDRIKRAVDEAFLDLAKYKDSYEKPRDAANAESETSTAEIGDSSPPERPDP